MIRRVAIPRLASGDVTPRGGGRAAGPGPPGSKQGEWKVKRRRPQREGETGGSSRYDVIHLLSPFCRVVQGNARRSSVVPGNACQSSVVRGNARRSSPREGTGGSGFSFTVLSLPKRRKAAGVTGRIRIPGLSLEVASSRHARERGPERVHEERCARHVGALPSCPPPYRDRWTIREGRCSPVRDGRSPQ